MFKRLIASLVCLTFSFSNLQYVNAQDFSVNQLPVPGTMIGESAPFVPLSLKGLIVNPQKPLEYQFIVDTGKGPQDTTSIKDQANQLVRYFLAGLTIPEGDLWVNLSPYEKNRMVPEALGQTDLGRDLLAQDYILKQLTASLIYPEKDLGKEFWSRVYAKTQQQFGTTNVPVNTFNKVWILPDQAQVFENVDAAYVTRSTLKVMLDEDYLAKQKHQATKAASISSQIVRDIVIPEITKEVNTGKNFAPLRQIYQALILAKWYKETIQNGLLDALYTNKNKVAGVNLADPAVKEQIYERYLKAYKKGAFNYIKEDPTPDGQVMPRKYFSGGAYFAGDYKIATDGAMSAVEIDGAMIALKVDLEKPKDATTLNEAAITPGEDGLTRPMTPGDFRAAILRVLMRLRKVGDLKKLWKMGFPELMDAAGGHEIKDPRYSALTMRFAFYVSPEYYRQIEADRDAFRKQHGIIGPLTLEDLYRQAPRVGYTAPETAGPYDYLANIHPEITGPGIYYHRHSSERVKGINDRKISILFHEMLEEEFHTYHLGDEIFGQWFYHEHPLLVVADVYLSAFLGTKTLSLNIETYRRQIRDIEDVRHPKLPDTESMNALSKKMIESAYRISLYNHALAEAHAELEDPLHQAKEDHLEDVISALKKFLDTAETFGFDNQVRKSMETELTGQFLPALPVALLPASDQLPMTTKLLPQPIFSGPQALQTGTKKSLRILIVDYEEDRKAIAVILRELETRYATSIQILSAKNPEEGLEIFNKSRAQGLSIHLLLTDYAFGGGMDGVELIKRIQKEEMVPTIMITGWDPADIKKQISRAHVTLRGLFEQNFSEHSISDPDEFLATLVHVTGLESYALARPYKPEKDFLKRFIVMVAELKATAGASVSISRVGKLYQIMLVGPNRSRDKSLEYLMKMAWISGQIAIETNSKEGFGYSFLIDAELVDLGSKVGAPEDQFKIFEKALSKARIVTATKSKELKGKTVPIGEANSAMLLSSPVSHIQKDVGGIDLNQINVLRNGKTVDVQFDPAQLNTLEQGGFEGFTPVIINMTRISSLFQLLGINAAKEQVLVKV